MAKHTEPQEVPLSDTDARTMDGLYAEMTGYMKQMDEVTAKMDACLGKMSRIVGTALNLPPDRTRPVFRVLESRPDHPHARVALVETIAGTGDPDRYGCYEFETRRCRIELPRNEELRLRKA